MSIEDEAERWRIEAALADADHETMMSPPHLAALTGLSEAQCASAVCDLYEKFIAPNVPPIGDEAERWLAERDE
jgi:hypothetical protein